MKYIKKAINLLAQTKKYYHVSDTWIPGEPLISWNLAQANEVNVGEWKWENAEEGFDGDVVSVYETLNDAKDHAEDIGGKYIIIIEPDFDAIERGEFYKTPYGYITPRLTKTEEGYNAFSEGIPTEWISNYINV